MGIYALIAALIMISHRESTLETITALVHDAPLMFIVGVFTLLGGLAWVLVHNRWRGGAPTVIITILGWITVAKGLFLFIAPADAPNFYLLKLHYAQLFYVYAGFSGLLGAYLCYGGFRKVAA
jgi:hypothetical protein